ncbi:MULTISPECIES: hypothetical protein [Phaeobacter]|uniref:hypothetical protein n=1 Tax=Phaeobacter TaxID=302485 RepID=UPI00058EB1BE|nr:MULTISPECIES: hypothetical protein [Phaeobacter]KII11663.1 membrane protein [Phaeobacter sp. S60]UTS82605.1 hypothetical protein OL67_003715 [Phaeobacter piscinae]
MTALWWAIIASGFYHGMNPGMGWPLAVSAALFEQKSSALLHALAALAMGHFIAMTAVLLPFSMMLTLVEYEAHIRVGAGFLVASLGVYLLINRRHPRFLARVSPANLGLWSFLAALAHGAGLMLVPIYLGICAVSELDAGHTAAYALMNSNVGLAFTVAAAHTAAMILAGGALAAGMYFWLGLKFLSKTWFNLDVVWALSLIVVGIIAIWHTVA